MHSLNSVKLCATELGAGIIIIEDMCKPKIWVIYLKEIIELFL